MNISAGCFATCWEMTWRKVCCPMTTIRWLGWWKIFPIITPVGISSFIETGGSIGGSVFGPPGRYGAETKAGKVKILSRLCLMGLSGGMGRGRGFGNHFFEKLSGRRLSGRFPVSRFFHTPFFNLSVKDLLFQKIRRTFAEITMK